MKKISLQKIILFVGIILLGFLAYRVHHFEDKLEGIARPARLFNPSTIISHFANSPEWDVKISPHHDRFFYVVTQQQLNWLGRGAQAYAFETGDGKFVVKFFQIGRIKEDDVEKGFIGELFSKESKEKRKQRLEHRREIFSSSKMCYEELPEETGIIYVHLNRTEDKIKGIKLVDRYGQSHRIRGDDACFVVQKKAKYLIQTISAHMDNGEFEAACARIDQIINLLYSVARKGFTDGDDALIRNNNIGFAEDKAIYIDTGHITRAPNINVRERMKYEFDVRLKPLENWLNVMYPKLAQYYSQKQIEVMKSLNEEEHAKAVCLETRTHSAQEIVEKTQIQEEAPSHDGECPSCCS